MAISGHFLGGAAEGLKSATDMAQADELLGLRRDTLDADTALRARGLDQELGLRNRALDLQAQSQKNAHTRALLATADKQVNDTLGVVSEAIAAAKAANADPLKVAQTVQPLVASAKRIAKAGGLNPDAIDMKVNTWMAAPSGVDVAAGQGRSAAAKTVATNQALTEAGVDTTPTWKSHDERVKAENSLRDDFTKASKDFVTQRDAKNRMDNIGDSGAGDVALIFSYMKLLDPGSTVREGEFATVQNSVGVVDTVRNAYNRALTGERLPEKLRKDIRTQADGLYQAAAGQQKKTSQSFKDIATRQRLDVDNVVLDLDPTPRPKSASGKTGDVPAPPPGFNIVAP